MTSSDPSPPGPPTPSPPPPPSPPAAAPAPGTEAIAAGDLLAAVYEELRRLAAHRIERIPPGQTLQATALVHEAWVRIRDRRPEGWSGRAEFFHAAARAMRDILVEDARRKAGPKRGGDRVRLVLDDVAGIGVEAPREDLLALDDALGALEVEHPDEARVVALRYFAGLTVGEVAEVTEASVSTVERRWRLARAWLRRRLDAGGDAVEREA